MHTIDFTLENLYPVILWVLKNANEYYNDQLIDFYKELSSPDNVKPYKSNQKVFERSEYRHNNFKNPEQISHYTLDYRIIMSRASIEKEDYTEVYITCENCATVHSLSEYMEILE